MHTYIHTYVPTYLHTNKHTYIYILYIYISINFQSTDEWIIVYDGNKIESDPHISQEKNKIKEYVYKGEGISGNTQGNYAFSKIKN